MDGGDVMSGAVKPTPFDGLTELAQEHFRRFREDFVAHGIRVPPELRMHTRPGMLCTYDLGDRQIYLSLPDPTDPIGNLQLLVYRPMLGCETNEELAELIRLLIPRLIAHELGHALRHAYDMFGEDLWHEEQVANIMASAATQQLYSLEERARLIGFLRRALVVLSEHAGEQHVAVDSYHNPLQALSASGELSTTRMRSLELMDRLFALSPERLLSETGQVPAALRERMGHRQDVIHSFNDDYTSGLARYALFQFGWTLIDLESREHHYLDEFARKHLGQPTGFLPAPPMGEKVGPDQILSCYRAYQDLLATSAVGSRYFYKRYRALLLNWLPQGEGAARAKGGVALGEDVRRLLESWDDADPATLQYAAFLSPPEVRPLFPQYIAEHAHEGPAEPVFPSDTDTRIWNLLTRGGDDPEAALTMIYLTQLDRVEIFRSLPAEILLRLTGELCRLQADPGETIIWEGSPNDDVFIVTRGRLEVLIARDGAQEPVGTICPGEVVGEMSFFTGEPRSATLRAIEPVECLVLRSSALRMLAIENPEVLTRMAGVLARRVRTLTRR